MTKYNIMCNISNYHLKERILKRKNKNNFLLTSLKSLKSKNKYKLFIDPNDSSGGGCIGI